MQPPATRPGEDGSLPREVPGFRLLRELGRGGMGVVYEAEEQVSGRVVALKVLASELSVSEEAFSRFQREARLAGAISDAHCVFVYGAHQIEGSPAISMELVGGETLEDRLRHDEPIPIETAVLWAIELLDGLDAAHEVGVVHRDVKPSNCFLTDDGRVKIGDFGLARTLEPDVRLTQSGAFLGSPLYASPEQVRGRPLDLRSDLYSAAATLYAMLTGSAPFSGGSVGEVLARILSETPPAPRALRPEIPRALEKVVLKAMSREPSGRYKSYAAFRQALAPFAAGTLRPARLPLRMAAMVIDTIPLSGINAIFVLGSGLSVMDPERTWILRSLPLMLALLSIPLLYFGLFEGLLGTTPGKWVFGQRVLAAESGHPSLWRAFLRAAVYYSTGVVVFLIMRSIPLEHQLAGSGAQSLLSLGMILLLFSTARPRNGWRAVHELVSGTRTTQRPSPFHRFRHQQSPLRTPVTEIEGEPASVGDYEIEGVLGRTPEGRMLRGRDPELDRSVWLHERTCDEGNARPRGGDRPARLRWLTSLQQGGLAYDVFEDPGGVALAALRSKAPMPWPLARRQLRALADELATIEGSDERAQLSTDQVWVDRSWKIRVLDVPVVAEPPEPRTPVEVLAESACILLGTEPGRDARLPADLPVHAEPAVCRLLSRHVPYENVERVRSDFAEWEGRPATVAPNLRAARVALSSAFPLMGSLLALLGLVTALVMFSEVAPGMELLKRLERAEAPSEAPAEAGEEADDETIEAPEGELLRAYHILIVDAHRSSFGPTVSQQFRGRRAELLEEALAACPNPTPEDVAWAEQRLAEHGVRFTRPKSDQLRVGLASFGVMLAAVGTLWLVVALVFSLVLRGGLSFRLTGTRLRSREGPLASRGRCLVRTLAAGAPVLLLIGVTVLTLGPKQLVLASILLGLALLLAVVGTGHALLAPGPSLQDRIAGTRLVPR